PGFQFNPGASGGKKVWRTFGPTPTDDTVLDVIPQSVDGTDPNPGAFKFSMYFNSSYMFGGQSRFDENIGTKTSVQTGQWYCLEFHFKKNSVPEQQGITPDGVLE